MENFNQIMDNDYANVVYQQTSETMPHEQQLDLASADKMAEEFCQQPEQSSQQLEQYQTPIQEQLQPQDAILIQNHQTQLQQNEQNSSVPMECNNGVSESVNEEAPPAENSESVAENTVQNPDNTEEVPVKEGDDAENPEVEAKAEAAESEIKEEQPEPSKPKEPKIDPEQCRACKSKENLQDIFSFKGDVMIANIIKIICPHLNISERDFLPHKICGACVEKVSAAYEFKQICEQTDKDFRQHLKRSYNKRRNASDYILLDAKVALLSSSEEEEMPDDDEFQVSKSEVSEESEDSVDSDFKPKKKSYKRKTPKKKPAPKSSSKKTKKTKAKPTKPTKTVKSNVVYIEADDDDDDNESDEAPPKKAKKSQATEGGLPCPHCDRILLNGHGLREHLKSHSTESFTCKICSKKFKLKLSLDAHMARHEEEKRKTERAKIKIVKVPVSQPKVTPVRQVTSVVKKEVNKKPEREGKDLFKTCAPITSTYWSDSFSD